MPAINPSRLDRQIRKAMAQAGDSERFVHAVREIVEYYADRTKRSSAASEALIISKVLRVPQPVLTAICTSIRAQPDIQPAARMQAADALWALGFRETRRIAVCLARGLEPDRLIHALERWSAACDDREVMHWMAEEGLQDWWGTSGADPWKTMRAWMAEDNHHRRQLALLALLSRVEHSHADADLPKIFRLLKGAAGLVRAGSYTTLVNLVRSLAHRSGQETARYLIDEVKRDTPGIRRMVRTCLDEFPPDLRADLEAAL